MDKLDNDNTSVAMDTSKGVNQTTEYPMSLYVTMHVLGLPLGVVIVVCNVLFLLVLKKTYSSTQQKTLKAKITVILTSLGVSEVLGGVILIINIGLYSAYDVMHSSTTGCYTWNLLKMIPLVSSFLHLLLITVERYIIVNNIPHYPHMTRLVVILGVVWSYAVVIACLAYAFMSLPAPPDAVHLCDIARVASLYVAVVIFAHIALCVIASTVLVLVIRNTVKLHQRKIQVSNTITYNNMVEDARIARLFYFPAVIGFLLWIPFLVCEILIAANVESSHLDLIVRWTFLLGHFSYLKCCWYVLSSKGLCGDCKNTFGKKKKRPFRMGTVVREG